MSDMAFDDFDYDRHSDTCVGCVECVGCGEESQSFDAPKLIKQDMPDLSYKEVPARFRVGEILEKKFNGVHSDSPNTSANISDSPNI